MTKYFILSDMGEIDTGAFQGAIAGYVERSLQISPTSILDTQEEQLAEGFGLKGFSFPTNEGHQKITKPPELRRLGEDRTIGTIADNIRTTIHSIQERPGGLYTGVNAFHHGHIAYLSKSEAIVSADMNEIVPWGYAFMFGLTAGSSNPEKFREQVNLVAAEPKKITRLVRGN